MEIKFRAFDKVNYMSIPFTLHDLQNKFIQLTSDCPVMQYTNLKDSTGKEIYADDILEDSKGKLFRVYNWHGGFVVKADCWNSNMNDLTFGDDLILEALAECQNASWINNCKVVGNIWENSKEK